MLTLTADELREAAHVLAFTATFTTGPRLQHRCATLAAKLRAEAQALDEDLEARAAWAAQQETLNAF